MPQKIISVTSLQVSLHIVLYFFDVYKIGVFFQDFVQKIVRFWSIKYRFWTDFGQKREPRIGAFQAHWLPPGPLDYSGPQGC